MRGQSETATRLARFTRPAGAVPPSPQDVVRLTSKYFDILLLLVENYGRLVTKEELMVRVWPDAFVEEGNLSYRRC